MDARRRMALATISAATGLLLLDVTVVNVALPAVRADLGASLAELEWVIDAYALALATTLLPAGVLADRIGRRRVFVGGLALFAAASALCGAAGSALVLDLARGVQGVGAAGMFSASLALLAAEFRGRARATALGVWGAVTGAALALGPLVGGALVDGPGWRWAFWLNLPLAVLLGVLTLRHVGESRDPAARRPDLPGTLAFCLGCFAVVFGLIRGNAAGWGSATVVVPLAAGTLSLAAWVALERRATNPMLDLRLFRIPAFTGTAVVAFGQSLALYPFLLFLAIYLQDVLGHTPWETGLRMLPLTLVLFVVAPLSGRLTAHVPLRLPLTAGLLLIATSLLLYRGLTPASGWTELLPGLIVGGLAIGTISPALAAAMVGVLSVERSGLASGVNNLFRQLGIAVGIAALGAIFQHRAQAGGTAAFVDGLNAIFAVAAIAAVAAAAIAWPLLGGLRSEAPAATEGERR